MNKEADAVHLLDEKTDQMIIMVHRGLSTEFVQEIMKLMPGEGHCGASSSNVR